MNQLKKHILFFDFLENHYASNDEVSIQHLNVIKKKSNFVKADKTIFKSTHPPLETILITTKKDGVTKEEVKASPFKIADDQTPIVSLIEQNNFTNQSWWFSLYQWVDRTRTLIFRLFPVIQRTQNQRGPVGDRPKILRWSSQLLWTLCNEEMFSQK